MGMADKANRRARVAAIDRVLREIGWHTQKQTAHMLARPQINLTLPQMVTLFAIHDSGTCRMSTLAELTQQSAGTLTGIVDRLIADGLVARVRNTSDRRVVEVTLTPEGERRLAQVTAARYEQTNHALSGFSDSDLATLEQLLGQFLEAVQHHDTQPSRLSRAIEA
jgi:DNA-binding MarR family transcriptional regulator